MAWPKGVTKAKTGGRKKGVPNKRSLTFEEALKGFCPLQEIIDSLPSLNDKDRVNACLQLLAYLYPRRKTLELGDLNVQVASSTALEALTAQLETLIRDKDGRHSQPPPQPHAPKDNPEGLLQRKTRE